MLSLVPTALSLISVIFCQSSILHLLVLVYFDSMSFVNFDLIKRIVKTIYRAQLRIISSAEVYLAGRRREPHIYPISFSLQLQLGLHPHQGGGMFIDNLYGYQYP